MGFLSVFLKLHLRKGRTSYFLFEFVILPIRDLARLTLIEARTLYTTSPFHFLNSQIITPLLK